MVHSTVFRCANRRVLLCTFGANLPCAKANSDRDLPGAETWCRDHPIADFVPEFAFPRGNILQLGLCRPQAQGPRPIEKIDPGGFVARYWKRAE